MCEERKHLDTKMTISSCTILRNTLLFMHKRTNKKFFIINGNNNNNNNKRDESVRTNNARLRL